MRQIIVYFEDIHSEGGKVFLDVRNDEEPICINDEIGYAKVIAIQSYGHQLDKLDGGMTARIWLDKMPQFIVRSSEPRPDVRSINM